MLVKMLTCVVHARKVNMNICHVS